MRLFLALPAIFLLWMCVAGSKQNLWDAEDVYFSEFDGGTGIPSFEIAEDRETFRKIFSRKIPYKSTKDTAWEGNQFPHLPEGRKAVFYNFKMSRGGIFQIARVNRIFLDGAVLKVFVSLQENDEAPQLQILTKPWMVFSVPQNLKFSKVEINQ